MGRKIHPVGFRLKIVRDWDARWYAPHNQFASTLQEDIKIRKFIMDNAGKNEKGEKEVSHSSGGGRDRLPEGASVSRIEIERNSNQVVVWVHTARPGIIIGQRGNAVKKLKTDLQTLTGKTVKVEVKEIDKPDLDAYLVAKSIAEQLERRIGHSRAIKRAISQAMRAGAQGIKIMVSGRLGGSDMARREGANEGRIPRSTLRANIDFAIAEALTTFGRIGVKVWIYKGDILQLPDEKKPAESKDVYVSP